MNSFLPVSGYRPSEFADVKPETTKAAPAPLDPSDLPFRVLDFLIEDAGIPKSRLSAIINETLIADTLRTKDGAGFVLRLDAWASNNHEGELERALQQPRMRVDLAEMIERQR